MRVREINPFDTKNIVSNVPQFFATPNTEEKLLAERLEISQRIKKYDTRLKHLEHSQGFEPENLSNLGSASYHANFSDKALQRKREEFADSITQQIEERGKRKQKEAARLEILERQINKKKIAERNEILQDYQENADPERSTPSEPKT
jgi:hypothetical protein